MANYFNYDQDAGAPFGPGNPRTVRHNATTFKTEYVNNAWESDVVPEDFYWSEFDIGGHGPWAETLASRIPSRNRCHRVGLQSPIDVRENGAICYEHHQIRVRVST